ncbi:hypothetical protein [Xenophilus sp. Marseille-Q4582]|uniref:hypothetical protein n=1 Tax=Xenophilus sp. Marseille-Q4582 TaxID=2866600 RepID=UPI001CE3C50D|nr:hypothetical protein [Xenophilus sp. Marseille-Q4582]
MIENYQQRINDLKPATKNLGELAKITRVSINQVLEAARDLEIDFWKHRPNAQPSPPDAARVYFAWPPEKYALYVCLVGTAKVGSSEYEREYELRSRRSNYLDAVASQDIKFAADRLVLLNLFYGLTYSMLINRHASDQAITASAFPCALDVGRSNMPIVDANTLSKRCIDYEGNWELRLYVPPLEVDLNSQPTGSAESLVVRVQDLVLLPELVDPLIRKITGGIDVKTHCAELQLVCEIFNELWVNAEEDGWKDWRRKVLKKLDGSIFFKKSQNMQNLVFWIFDSLNDQIRILSQEEEEKRKNSVFHKRKKAVPDRLKVLLEVSAKFWGKYDDKESCPFQKDVSREFVAQGFPGKWADAAANLVAKVRRKSPETRV